MIINNKMLHIPPFISVSWRDVWALFVRDNRLVVSLFNGETVEIPGLPGAIVQKVFTIHATVLEQQEGSDSANRLVQSIGTLGVIPMENLGTLLQHNASQAHAPNLPPELIEKVASVTKALLPDDPDQLPVAEPHCNCFYCQVARAMRQESPQQPPQATQQAASAEDPVPDKELVFQQWDVKQAGDQLFEVINRLDTKEHYSVFLGQPIGCTCGKTNCEHLIAVLQS